MTDHYRRPNDNEIVTRAVELLAHGLLPSVLPSTLMREFGLTAEKAHDLASDAIKRHEEKKEPGKRDRLDTEPIDQEEADQ